MSLLQQWNASACAWILRHLDAVSVAIVASAMVMVGAEITKAIRRRTRHWHFGARTLIFILVNGLAFGMIVAILSPQLARALRTFGVSYLLITTLAAFIAVGLLAQRHRQI